MIGKFFNENSDEESVNSTPPSETEKGASELLGEDPAHSASTSANMPENSDTENHMVNPTLEENLEALFADLKDLLPPLPPPTQDTPLDDLGLEDADLEVGQLVPLRVTIRSSAPINDDNLPYLIHTLTSNGLNFTPDAENYLAQEENATVTPLEDTETVYLNQHFYVVGQTLFPLETFLLPEDIEDVNPQDLMAAIEAIAANYPLPPLIKGSFPGPNGEIADLLVYFSDLPLAETPATISREATFQIRFSSDSTDLNANKIQAPLQVALQSLGAQFANLRVLSLQRVPAHTTPYEAMEVTLSADTVPEASYSWSGTLPFPALGRVTAELIGINIDEENENDF